MSMACILAGVLLALATLVHPTQETPRIILAQEVPLEVLVLQPTG